MVPHTAGRCSFLFCRRGLNDFPACPTTVTPLFCAFSPHLPIPRVYHTRFVPTVCARGFAALRALRARLLLGLGLHPLRGTDHRAGLCSKRDAPLSPLLPHFMRLRSCSPFPVLVPNIVILRTLIFAGFCGLMRRTLRQRPDGERPTAYPTPPIPRTHTPFNLLCPFCYLLVCYYLPPLYMLGLVGRFCTSPPATWGLAFPDLPPRGFTLPLRVLLPATVGTFPATCHLRCFTTLFAVGLD